MNFVHIRHTVQTPTAIKSAMNGNSSRSSMSKNEVAKTNDEKNLANMDERITVNGTDVWLKKKTPNPPPFTRIEYPQSLRIDLMDPSLVTPNYQDAGAGTWKIIQGGQEPPNPMQGGQYTNSFSVEVSKRRKPMTFWHRNMDNDELITCVSGRVTWETELGTVVLTPGQMFLIPRGVSHHVVPDESPQYVAIEIKAPTMKILNVSAPPQSETKKE